MTKLFYARLRIHKSARKFIKVLELECQKHNLTLNALGDLIGYDKDYYRQVVMCHEKLSYEFAVRLRHLLENGPTEIEWVILQAHARAKKGLL